MLWGVKRSTNTHCLLWETGQLPLHLYCFRCVVRFWNSLLRTNNTLLSKINQADLLLAHKRGSWTFEVLSALCKIPGADVHISAIMCRSKIKMSDFKLNCESRPYGNGEIWTRFIHMMHMFPAESSHPFWSALRDSDWLVG